MTSTTQTIVIGQRVQVCASYLLPQGITVSSQTWSIPGWNSLPPTAIANFTANASAGTVNPITAASLSQAAVAFYFVTPGTGRSVMFTLTLSNSVAVSATVTYNVNGIMNPALLSVNNNLYTIKTWTGCPGVSAGPQLVYGDVVGPTKPCEGIYTGTPGVDFQNTSGSQPTGGSFEFVQLIATDTRSYRTVSAPGPSCSSTAGIDTSYPYILNNIGHATDAPAMPLPSLYATASRTFNATMYLLWSASDPQSIPVPLFYQSWGFTASSSQQNNVWGNAGGFGGFFTGVTASNGSYPQWTTVTTQTCH